MGKAYAVNVESALSGRIRIERSRAGGEREVVRDWYSNRILDNGLDMIGSDASPAPRAICCVGGGSAPPANNQTALTTFIANNSSASHVAHGAASVPPYYGSTITEYVFDEGVAAGTLTEIGVGKTNTNLFMRALIPDAQGSPTQIPVLAEDTLYILHELRLYPPTTDVVGTTDIDGVPTTYIIRPSAVNNNSPTTGWCPPQYNQQFTTKGSPDKKLYAGTLGTVLQTPNGAVANGTNTAVVESAYVAGSFTRTAYFTEFESDANLEGGVRSITRNVRNMGMYQIQFTPAIQKNTDMILRLETGVSWGRYDL